MKNKYKVSNIINKYDKILKDYQDGVFSEIFPILEKRRKKYDVILNKMNGFYFITNYISEHGGLETKNVFEKAFLTIYNKAALDLLGIYHCLYQGLGIQAGIIYRSIYETYVYNDFIFKEDTEERVKLFYNFQFIQRWVHIKNSMKNNPEYIKRMKIDKKRLELYKEYYNRFICDYNQKRPYHWAYKIFNEKLKGRNPSLLDICKYLGEYYVREYNSVYGLSSTHTHPSSILGDYFTVPGENVNSSINAPRYNDEIMNLSLMSMLFCGRTILKIIDYFNIENLDEITIYIKSYISIALNERTIYQNKIDNSSNRKYNLPSKS